jgi:hypothetical protein
MSTVIKLKKSETALSKPTTSDLAVGEVAINALDQRLFVRDSNDNIVTIGEAGGLRHESSTVTYTVTVATKDSSHRYNGSGSSSGYKIDGSFSPTLKLVPGNTYRFDQEDSSNSGHPLRFYYESDKTTAYTTGVTTNGTAGSSGAYTEIVVSDSTPSVLHYQCSSHSLMGNQVVTNTRNLTGFDTDDISEGSSNLYYTDTRADARVDAGFTARAGNANEIMIVDSTGNDIESTDILSLDTTNNYLGINQTSPEVTLHMTGEGAQTAQIRMEQYNDSADAPDVRTRRYRGTISSPSAVSSGDYLYRSNHEYWNGSSLIVGGSFAFDNTNNANRTQFAVSVTTDGTSADPNNASKTQFKIDGNDSGAITFNNAYKFPTSDGSANQVLQTDGSGNLSFASISAAGGSGIALTDLSVGAEGTASGDGDISYNNTTGVFTYTPPDLSSYITSVAFSDLTGTPTTIAGYGITDAFDGDYNNLTNTPTIPSDLTDLGISDGTSGQVLTTDGSGNFTFTSVSGAGGSGNAFTNFAVSGQSTVQADSSTDTLTLVGAGLNTITTDAITDTITIGTPTGIPFVKEDGTSTSLNLSVEAGTLSTAVQNLYIPFTKEDGTSVTTLVMN